MSLKDRILFYAFRNPVPVTLRELYQFGENPSPKTLILIAQFLQKELPVRFAQRLRDLKRLPFGLAETPSMQEVRKVVTILLHCVEMLKVLHDFVPSCRRTSTDSDRGRRGRL